MYEWVIQSLCTLASVQSCHDFSPSLFWWVCGDPGASFAFPCWPVMLNISSCAICISSAVKYLFIFGPLSNWVIFFFSLLGFESYLCALDARLLLNMRFANIFSHPVACPFIFLTSLPQSMSWSFREFQLYHFGEGLGF